MSRKPGGVEIIKNLVMIRGGGDLATGVVHRLVQCGFKVIILEIETPSVIRRTVSLAQAVFDGSAEVEGLKAVLADNTDQALKLLEDGIIPVLIDPSARSVEVLKPEVVVDAIIAKKNLGTHREMAPIVIGLGPGFCAGQDVHAVVETNRGHNLGRVFYQGCAEPDTGFPGNIGGYDKERILRAPSPGRMRNLRKIGDQVKQGEVMAFVGETPVVSPLDGVLRGLIADGVRVTAHLKIGDIDPRGRVEYCFTISDKARSIAGGVLEAILALRRPLHH